MANNAASADGCEHYRRGCQKLCKQCNDFFDCRLCHDEKVFKHAFDRFATDTVRCNSCGTVQPFGQQCTNAECQRSFGTYMCLKCKLLDGKRTDDQIFHCDKCMICRVGRKEDFTHCDTCHACIRGTHRCFPEMMKSNCPVCREYLFDSRQDVILLRCGHPMHSVCLQQLMQHDFRCPLCLKSVGNMRQVNRMIDNHLRDHPLNDDALAQNRETISVISCHECRKRSEAPFHYLYHKCAHCNGYNTTVLSTRKRTPLDTHVPDRWTPNEDNDGSDDDDADETFEDAVDHNADDGEPRLPH